MVTLTSDTRWIVGARRLSCIGVQCREVHRRMQVLFVLGTLAGCESGLPAQRVTGGVPLVPVVAPRGGEGDRVQSLVDGRVEVTGWYCSSASVPQRYEVMFADAEVRAVRGVGFVLGNLGPDGVGPVEIRVQRGHGVTAPGKSFRAEVRGQGEQLRVVMLPTPVRGDHVVVSFLRRSPFHTALCLAELVVYTDEIPRFNASTVVVQAEPIASSSGSPRRAVAHAVTDGTDAAVSTSSGTEGAMSTEGLDAGVFVPDAWAQESLR